MHSKQDSDIIQAEISKHLNKWFYHTYREREYDDIVSNIFKR